jgi:hypothetical protein
MDKPQGLCYRVCIVESMGSNSRPSAHPDCHITHRQDSKTILIRSIITGE